MKKRILGIIGGSGLYNIDGLENCRELKSLDLSNCSSINNVDGLSNSKNYL